MTRSVIWISTEMNFNLKCIVLACSIWVFFFHHAAIMLPNNKKQGRIMKKLCTFFFAQSRNRQWEQRLGLEICLGWDGVGRSLGRGWLVLLGLEAARPGSPNAAADISPLTPHHNIQHSNTLQTQVKTQIHEYTKVILLIESNWRCCRQTLHFQIHCHSYKEEESAAKEQTLVYNSGEI